MECHATLLFFEYFNIVYAILPYKTTRNGDGIIVEQINKPLQYFFSFFQSFQEHMFLIENQLMHLMCQKLCEILTPGSESWQK